MRLSLVLGVAATLGLAGCSAAAGGSTPTPRPTLARVLYRSGSGQGLSGWRAAGARTWSSAGGILRSRGVGFGTGSLVAPFTPKAADTSVQASIRFVRDYGGRRPNFGLALHADRNLNTAVDLVVYPSHGYISVWSDRAQRDLVRATFHPGSAWHTYRLTALGPDYLVSVDGRQVARARFAGAPGGSRVGLFSASCALAVRAFQVVKLSRG